MYAGDVVVMNAHMWHGGTANRTGHPRRAMHVYYTRWDQPQQQYQKRLLSAEVAFTSKRLPMAFWSCRLPIRIYAPV